MKKVLLAGTALVGAAFFAAPAQAELKLGLGGHFSGYAVYVDEDDGAAGAKDFGFRRNTEIHFTGETTLDNGLTVGVHVEQEIENGTQNNESYAYFSGGWGRVNFGNEDGAAYLLQVAAPSADSNVDGLRSTIQGFTSEIVLDYDHALAGNGPSDNPAVVAGNAGSTDRLTYLTPKFNGFQAGVSYSPEVKLNTGIAAPTAGLYEDLWEIAARWDGEFEGVGLSLGAGYSKADAPAGANDPKAWNVGANFGWNQFSFGGAYLREKEGAEQQYLGSEKARTWVVGAAWNNGPYHVGASYLDRKDETAGAADVDSYKATIGGGYTFGPGMTFRGAIAWGETITPTSTEEDFTQVTIGTDIRF
jgi:outer membrane protein OmpU